MNVYPLYESSVNDTMSGLNAQCKAWQSGVQEIEIFVIDLEQKAIKCRNFKLNTNMPSEQNLLQNTV